jgi:hypothetical protein
MVSFTSWPSYPREIVFGTHWIESWMDPRAGLDAASKRKIPSLAESKTPVAQPAT